MRKASLFFSSVGYLLPALGIGVLLAGLPLGLLEVTAKPLNPTHTVTTLANGNNSEFLGGEASLPAQAVDQEQTQQQQRLQQRLQQRPLLPPPEGVVSETKTRTKGVLQVHDRDTQAHELLSAVQQTPVSESRVGVPQNQPIRIRLKRR